GTGVASAVYPHMLNPGSEAEIVYTSGNYIVRIGAADIGTGSRTVLGQIAADALAVPISNVRMEIGDSDLPTASVAGGFSGTSSWCSVIVAYTAAHSVQ